ncbi:MAG: TIGR02996 domain-containing protein [Gemmataceae bacterium]|nr:TIGR02996 domain-containing protein [Gemmataceae bacterium]
MSDEDALLAAIRAHPDEDTPRLIYADWLDEHGDSARAEFIRLQCAPELGADGRARVFELEHWHRSRWLARLPRPERVEWAFRRGFPEGVTLTGWDLMIHQDALAEVPWVRTLAVTYVTELALQHFVGRVWNPGWIELELQASSSFVAANTATIANCPQVAQLRALRLSRFHLGAAALDLLATSPSLANLQQLRLDSDLDEDALPPLRARFGDRLRIG